MIAGRRRSATSNFLLVGLGQPDRAADFTPKPGRSHRQQLAKPNLMRMIDRFGSFDPCATPSANDGVDGAPNGISVPRWSLSEPHLKGSRPMGKSIQNLSTVTRVGLDLAKRVFQVHAVEG